jgi:repressor LexA
MDVRPKTLVAFGAAIRRRREGLELTLDGVAGKTGISKPYLSNIETGRTPGPPSEGKLVALAGALEWGEAALIAAADWLRTPVSVRKALAAADSARTPRREDGTIDLDRLMAAEGAAGTGEAGEGEMAVRMVPVINRVAAGKAEEYTDLDYPAGVAEEYVPAPEVAGAPVKSAFALRVTGDSMMPEYAEGEIVIVGPGEARDGDDCVVRLGRGANFATTFKRVFFVREGEGVERVRLVALNVKYGERVVAAEEVTGIYPVMYRLVAVKRGDLRAVGDGGL